MHLKDLLTTKLTSTALKVFKYKKNVLTYLMLYLEIIHFGILFLQHECHVVN